MAVYHCSVKVLSRADGRSVVAASAYRAGADLHDERLGKTFAYSRRERIETAEILLPPGAAAHMADRQALWNAAEAAERRKDSRVAREVEVSILRELTPEQGRELVRSFAMEHLVSRGLAVDYAIHAPRAADGQDNRHAHILVTVRQVTAEGMGAKVTALDKREWLAETRQAWAEHANRALAAAGSDVRIDHRSLADQGQDREPEGKARTPEDWHRTRLLRQQRQAEAEVRAAEAQIHDLAAERQARQESWRDLPTRCRAQATALRTQAAAVQIPPRRYAPPPRSAEEITADRRAQEAQRVALIRHNAGKLDGLAAQEIGVLAWLFSPAARRLRRERNERAEFAHEALDAAEAQAAKLDAWLDSDSGKDWAKTQAAREKTANWRANHDADQATRQLNDLTGQANDLERVGDTIEGAMQALDDPRLPEETKALARLRLTEAAKYDPDAIPRHVLRDLAAVGALPAAHDAAEQAEAMTTAIQRTEAQTPAPVPAPAPAA